LPGGVAFSHIRRESEDLLDGLAEASAFGELTGAGVKMAADIEMTGFFRNLDWSRVLISEAPARRDWEGHGAAGLTGRLANRRTTGSLTPSTRQRWMRRSCSL